MRHHSLCLLSKYCRKNGNLRVRQRFWFSIRYLTGSKSDDDHIDRMSLAIFSWTIKSNWFRRPNMEIEHFVIFVQFTKCGPRYIKIKRALLLPKNGTIFSRPYYLKMGTVNKFSEEFRAEKLISDAAPAIGKGFSAAFPYEHHQITW